MSSVRVVGGIPLRGSVRIQGSKNAVLPMIAGAILHRGITVLQGCPKIEDVDIMGKIVTDLGGKVAWNGNDLTLDCTDVSRWEVRAEYAGKMRCSILLMGPLLARFGHARMYYPGGCVIGERPIDQHRYALTKLGAKIVEEEALVYATCEALTGTEITFGKVSVGATQQAILAAVLAPGKTVLTRCAREPEIRWLAEYLNHMGAKIRGAGTPRIQIQGVKELSDTRFAIPPDRIVTGTYLCAAAITRGYIRIENFQKEEIESLLCIYSEMGGQYEVNGGKLVLDARNVEKPVPYVATGGYPNFPTDLQSILMAVTTTVSGISTIQETIFENRYKVVEELVHMGARIQVRGECACVTGSRRLSGTDVYARELRGGAALILAGLAADGETVVHNYEYVQRGYEDICRDLRTLGGIIKIQGSNI